jgi:hypothetical protein
MLLALAVAVAVVAIMCADDYPDPDHAWFYRRPVIRAV